MRSFRPFFIYLILAVGLASCGAGPVAPYVFPPADTPPHIAYSRGFEWEAFHHMLANTPGKDKIELVFFGDSITARWENGILQAHWSKHHPAAFGIGGDRTQQLLWRIQQGELKGMKPKALVLLIGTNNLEADSPEAIATGIRQVITELKRALPGTRIIVMGILPRGQSANDPYRARIDQVNAIISRYDDGRRVRYIDPGSSLLMPDGSISRAIMPDYLHLSPLGYEMLAMKLDPVLNPILKRNR